VPNQSRNDDDLLAAARAGNPGAIEALLEEYQDRIFGFGLRMCGDREDAKEVLQDTMLAAARGMKDFQGGSSLSTWLFTIARSFCIKKRRKSAFAPTDEVSLADVTDGLPAATPTPDELASRQEVKRALVAALQRLDPDSREVLVLRDVEGLTAPEVARITASTVDAVKSRLHRARAAVRTHVDVMLGDPQPKPGRDCPDVLAEFSKNLEGDLDPSLCAELQRHLDGCKSCRNACDSLKRTLAACADATAGPVPDAVKSSVRAAVGEVLRARR